MRGVFMSKNDRQIRIVVFLSFLALAFLLSFGKVFYLQVIKGEKFAAAAVAQRTAAFVYDSGRGDILDREGRKLHSREVKQVYGPETMIGSFSRFPAGGLNVMSEIRYSEDSLASHVTGYIKKPRSPLQPQDGICGLERTFNQELWGMPAAIGVIVDAKKEVVPGIGLLKWESNHFFRPYDVITTIDFDLQKIVEDTGESLIKKGAVVVLEAESGDILAMASFPCLPVEKLYGGLTNEDMKNMEGDGVFLNRALRQYAPGSVFKTVLAAAALEKGLPEVPGLFVCDGSYELGNSAVKCIHGTAHGVLDLPAALAASCNGYFINLAQRLWEEDESSISEMAGRFKLGRVSSIPLGGEMPGYIPVPEDIRYGGDLANMAIGQGLVAVSPLQLARLMAMITNGGRTVYPRLVMKITDKNGSTVRNYPSQYGPRVLKGETVEKLQKMLQTVVSEGTAASANSPLYRAAGKSGTAELDGADFSHSWFAGYVNIDNNNLAAAVFIEEWRPDRETASVVFRQIMEKAAAFGTKK